MPPATIVPDLDPLKHGRPHNLASRTVSGESTPSSKWRRNSPPPRCRNNRPYDSCYIHHTHLLDKDALWRNAADFTTNVGQRVGVKAARLYEGNNELTVYCDPAIGIADRVAFMRYIDDHIRARATEVTRSRHYTCEHCKKTIGDVDAVAEKLANGEKDMLCVRCERRTSLWDEIERRFGQVEARRTVAKMNAEADIILSNQNKEQILVGEVGAIAGKGGQIFRPTVFADNGIDGEIEFNTAQGVATGKKVYVQLKSGDSYLRQRQRDNAEVFDIPEPRHIDYWLSQPCDVWLVIRTSDARIRWRNITAALKSQPKRSRQVIFTPEDFTPTTLLTLRDRLIALVCPDSWNVEKRYSGDSEFAEFPDGGGIKGEDDVLF